MGFLECWLGGSIEAPCSSRLVVPPLGLVLAPLRGPFTAFVSLSDRQRRAIHGPTLTFTRVHAGESWLPRFVQRCGLPARGSNQSAFDLVVVCGKFRPPCSVQRCELPDRGCNHSAFDLGVVFRENLAQFFVLSYRSKVFLLACCFIEAQCFSGLAVPPFGRVLAPLRDNLTAFVSRSDRQRRTFLIARRISRLVVPPLGLVLAPLRGPFTAFVSLSDRQRRAIHGPTLTFTRVHAGESWLPRFVQRCGLPARGNNQSAFDLRVACGKFRPPCSVQRCELPARGNNQSAFDLRVACGEFRPPCSVQRCGSPARRSNQSAFDLGVVCG